MSDMVIIPPPEEEPAADPGTALAIRDILGPVMQQMAALIQHNTEALEQLSAAQSIQNDRLEALEKQVRLQTPVSSTQARYLRDAMRKRAREMMEKRGIADAKANAKIAAAIRRAVLVRYGVNNIRDIPKYEYNVALSMVDMWSDALTLRDVANEYRKKERTEA